MPVGKMRYLVTLQSPSGSADSMGGLSTAFSNIDQVYADIVEKSASERLLANQNEEVKKVEITIRYRRDVNNGDRVKYEYTVSGVTYTRLFNIKGITNDGNMDKYLIMDCEEGVAT